MLLESVWYVSFQTQTLKSIYVSFAKASYEILLNVENIFLKKPVSRCSFLKSYSKLLLTALFCCFFFYMYFALFMYEQHFTEEKFPSKMFQILSTRSFLSSP